MLTPFLESREVTSATQPGLSRLWTIRVGASPVKFTRIPSSRLTRIRPPPREAACTSRVRPSAEETRRMAVFGCASFKLILWNVKVSPASAANEKLSGMRISSGCMPSSPAISARSVPCPVPVAAKEPEREISACTGAVPRSRRVISPIRTAPAV